MQIILKRPNFKTDALIHLDCLWQAATWLTEEESRAFALVDSTITEAYLSWDDPIPGGDCKTWLFKIMTKRYLSGFKQDLNKAMPNATNYANDCFFYDRLSLIKAMPAEAINQAFALLLADIRLVMILLIIGGLTYEEIADMVGVSVEGVRSRLYLGHKFMRTEIKKYLIAKDKLNVNMQ